MAITKNIKIFLSKKQRVYLAFLSIGILISTGLEMIGVGSIPVFINLLLKPEQIFSYLPQNDFVIFITSKDYRYQILFASAVLLTIFVIKNLFIFVVNYLQVTIFQEIKIGNTKRLFQSYLTSPYSSD